MLLGRKITGRVWPDFAVYLPSCQNFRACFRGPGCPRKVCSMWRRVKFSRHLVGQPPGRLTGLQSNLSEPIGVMIWGRFTKGCFPQPKICFLKAWISANKTIKRRLSARHSFHLKKFLYLECTVFRKEVSFIFFLLKIRKSGHKFK